MPRRGKNRNRGGRKGQGGFNAGMASRSFIVPYSVCFNLVTTTSGFDTNNVGIHPSLLGPNAARIASCFEWYRVIKMRCKFVPGVRAVNSESYQYAVSYSGEVNSSSAPGGMTQMSEMPCFSIGDGSTISIVIPRRQLLGTAVKWWRCEFTASPPNDLLYQGVVWLASLTAVAPTASLTAVCQISGLLEFRSPIDEADSVPRPLSDPDDEKAVVVNLPKEQPISRLIIRGGSKLASQGIN